MNVFDPEKHVRILGGFVKKQSDVALTFRKISTGAMQRRFTVYEELAIEADPVSRVIRSRLFNAGHCDLDFTDTQDGLAVIVNMLTGAVNPVSPQSMLVLDFNTRFEELLKDGTIDEAI
ncbi:MAG: hypothetical protein MJK12_12395 [Colwellia sp.]|nr:hypothetical protein [Colwellia sp.]